MQTLEADDVLSGTAHGTSRDPIPEVHWCAVVFVIIMEKQSKTEKRKSGDEKRKDE